MKRLVARAGGSSRPAGPALHRVTRVCGVLLVVLSACGQLDRERAVPACEPVERRTVREDLCEDVYSCARGSGEFDRIGLRRLARCGRTRGAVVLYLPGAHMNGSLPEDDARQDFRYRLASRGVRTWAIDYRTHAVPNDATPEQLAVLRDWNAELFTDDAAWAADVVRRVDRGPLVVAGFSYGAGLAYRVAARPGALAGLVILDGSPPDGAPTRERTGPAIDVGGSRLPFAERRRLLAAVRSDPDGPSTVPGYATAGEALADIVYTTKSFGGRGGLSAARDGVTDVRALAHLLGTYDRWWPTVALGGAAVAPTRRVPVLAFAASRMGPRWTERVRAGARAWGGEGAAVRELDGFGHVDVLAGRDTDRLVIGPVVTFLRSLTPARSGRRPVGRVD